MPSPSTRQWASAFNQQLSLDTSSVTTMRYMFFVRSARALRPQALRQAIPVHASCVPPPHHTGPPAFRLAPLPPASHALPSTRQAASAFNQPLSFDTSSVTDMNYMFQVRSARALGPQSFESRAPCMPSLPPRTLSPASRHAPRPQLYTRPPFDSRQGAGSLSAANKLLIRCAWAGTAAFDSNARYLSGTWPSTGSCA